MDGTLVNHPNRGSGEKGAFEGEEGVLRGSESGDKAGERELGMEPERELSRMNSGSAKQMPKLDETRPKHTLSGERTPRDRAEDDDISEGEDEESANEAVQAKRVEYTPLQLKRMSPMISDLFAPMGSLAGVATDSNIPASPSADARPRSTHILTQYRRSSPVPPLSAQRSTSTTSTTAAAAAVANVNVQPAGAERSVAAPPSQRAIEPITERSTSTSTTAAPDRAQTTTPFHDAPEDSNHTPVSPNRPQTTDYITTSPLTTTTTDSPSFSIPPPSSAPDGNRPALHPRHLSINPSAEPVELPAGKEVLTSAEEEREYGMSASSFPGQEWVPSGIWQGGGEIM